MAQTASKEHDTTPISSTGPPSNSETWNPSPVETRWSRLIEYMRSPIRPSHFAELQLLLLTFTTGMQDATTFPDYHCFASNQTGNTVMLALSITMPQQTRGLFVTANIGVSLPLFLFGAYITGQIGNHLCNRLSRAWLLFINLVQTAMIFAAAGLQYRYEVHLESSRTLAIIALLAFASGSQVVISRSLRMTEISTAMATAAWVDLLVDPGLLTIKNQPRNRRVYFLLALVAGCFTGAALYTKTGSAFTILISAVGKTMVMFMFLFNPSSKGNRLAAGSAV